MTVRIEKSFDRDVTTVRDNKVLNRLLESISLIERAKLIREVPHVKKIQGYTSFYRLRIGDYRLGLELLPSGEVVLLRFLHRKEIYRYFPPK